VEFFVDTSQPFVVNVRINLGSGYVNVTEHFLNASQIGPAGQQMRGKAMSQCVDS